MSWQRYLRRAKWDRDRLAEIESYVQIATDENIARGMPPHTAHEAARKKLGNRTLIREEIYHMNTIAFFDAGSRNIRHGLRTLRRNPMFTAAALLTLALGIGANTAVFSVVNSVLLKPLAYPDSESLVAVRQTKADSCPTCSLPISPSMYFTYTEQNQTFQAFGVWSYGNSTVTGLAEPEQVRTVSVSNGALQALGVRPVLGRWPGPAEHVPQGPLTAMLSYGYWQRRFGGDPAVIGRVITVESRSREIVGVMPQGFRFVTADPDLILPLALDRSQAVLAQFNFQGVARLKPGVTVDAANADLGRMLPIWLASWPSGPGLNQATLADWRITPAIRPLKQEVTGTIGSVLWVVMGTIGIVMLIACANVANLLLVRAEARQQELAVRAALGAGWGRILRELLLESVLLALLGGAIGLALADGGLRVLVAMGPTNLPRLAEISLDARALAFAFAVSLLSGLLFGLIPALKYSGLSLSPTLRSGGRNSSHSRERHRARNLLVVGQVALALVLLVSSGLMIRTFQALRAVEPGFTHGEQLQTLRISIPAALVQEPERVARIQSDIRDKLAAIPGTTSVAFANVLPLEGDPIPRDLMLAEGKTNPAGETPAIRMYKWVSPGLFQTVGTRLLAGRDFTWTDLQEHRMAVMLSENLAREFWGTPAAAVGKRVRPNADAPWREVIGVVQDVKDNSVQEQSIATVYWPATGVSPWAPLGQADTIRTVVFAARTNRAGTQAYLDQVQQAVWSANGNLPLAFVRTLQDVYDRSVARTSFTLVMLAIAGSMALLLGVIGIYGVISYGVSQRRREIGIRLALGAQQGELKGMFVRQGLALTGIGVVIGSAAAVALTRLMSTLLFGVDPLDLPTFAAVAALLALAAVLASYLPARRASRVDAVEALRAE